MYYDRDADMNLLQFIKYCLWDVWVLYSGGRWYHIKTAFLARKYGPYWAYLPHVKKNFPELWD